LNIEAISIGDNPPEDVNVIIEVPIGGEPIKYEMNKAAGALFVDRFLYTPMRYPGNYGFVPHTLSDDGDPIDVLVANSRPIAPGAVINRSACSRWMTRAAATRRSSPCRCRN
jgi:inorganic pyrophosphatase